MPESLPAAQSTIPVSSKDKLVLAYWRSPDGYYLFDGRKAERKEMVEWFRCSIVDSTAPAVEIFNKATGKSTHLVPRTIQKIRDGSWALMDILLY